MPLHALVSGLKPSRTTLQPSRTAFQPSRTALQPSRTAQHLSRGAKHPRHYKVNFTGIARMLRVCRSKLPIEWEAALTCAKYFTGS